MGTFGGYLMKLQQAKDWLLMGLLTAAVYVLWDMKKSVESLNTSVATVIERSVWQEKQLNLHEARIYSLEKENK